MSTIKKDPLPTDGGGINLEFTIFVVTVGISRAPREMIWW